MQGGATGDHAGAQGYDAVTDVWRALEAPPGELVPPLLVACPPEISMTDLAGASETSFYREAATQTLWLKIMEAANSIPIEDDGRGQLLLLDF